jgi:hypothetical protein
VLDGSIQSLFVEMHQQIDCDAEESLFLDLMQNLIINSFSSKKNVGGKSILFND